MRKKGDERWESDDGIVDAMKTEGEEQVVDSFAQQNQFSAMDWVSLSIAMVSQWLSA